MLGISQGSTACGIANVAVANAGIAAAFSEGWFSDPGALVDVFLWAALLAAISAFGYVVARSLRRTWAGTLAALLPFVVALYFFYQNVNRLLPPNL